MVVSSSSQYLKNTAQTSPNLDLQSFCQLQIEQLTIQDPIFCVRVVYSDCFTKTREEVINYAISASPFSSNILAYLRAEEWLIDYPPVFSLNKISLNFLTCNCYICPVGYRHQKPEYLQIFTHEPLSPRLQAYIENSAMLLSKYLDIYLDSRQKQAKIQLLEHIIQRANHQLRNSLGLISLYAQNLLLALQNNPYQDQAEIINETIQELNGNLTEILYCGQSAKLKVSLQDLGTLVQESIKNLQPLINQKQLQIILSGTPITLAIDRVQMKQVFDNLLSNAVHFSPQLGTITCNWQVFHGEVLIKISDQGPGLSQEDMQKLFTPFYSRRPGGTGLGLTIAKKIILDHQGNLWAQNLGGSAQFSVILPQR